MEQHILNAFFISALAGLSTMLGTIMLFFTKKTNIKFLSASLGFSAGAMIFVSFVDIIPEALRQLELVHDENSALGITMLAFFGGIALMTLIDKLIPEENNPHEMKSEKTIEDVYLKAEDESPEEIKCVNTSSLRKVGIFTALAIAIHNFPEGIATFLSSVQDPNLGIIIAVAVAIHNIPEGISVAVPIYYGSGCRKEAFLYSFLSGIAEPIGGLFAYFLFLDHATPAMMGIVFAAVSGIMIYISLDELLPAAEEYGNHHTAMYGNIFGMIFMALSLYLLS
ncbi:MAG: zinc transporter ZupT [Tissierellia bacterium]|nr:zinc transporter ZupT [Tissierellia bacterium]